MSDGAPSGALRTLVVVNPTSAGGRTAARWPRLRDELRLAGVAFDVHETGGPADATSATRAALETGYLRVIAAGGDGTLGEVLNGFFSEDGVPQHPEAVLALLPSGTGGDFRRALGLPSNPAQLARIIHTNHLQRIDVGRVTFDDTDVPPRQFINIADCGVGGAVVARVNSSRIKAGGLRGTAVFLGISLATLMTFGSRPVRVTLDGEVVEADAENVVIANGQFFGGGMKIAPNALLDDGLFDVVILPAYGKLRTLAAVPSVYRGTHLRQPGVLARRATTVRVEPLDDRALLFDIEGEQIGAAPATAVCIPGAVNVCVP